MRIKFPAMASLSCIFRYDSEMYSSYSHHYSDYKQHDCAPDLETTAIVSINTKQDVNKVPLVLDMITIDSIDVPDGWTNEYYYCSEDEFVCPECAKRLPKP